MQYESSYGIKEGLENRQVSLRIVSLWSGVRASSGKACDYAGILLIFVLKE